MIKKSIQRWNELFRTRPAKSKLGAKARMNGYLRVAVWSPLLLGFGFGIYWSVSYVQESERLEVRRISVSGLHRVTENEVLASIGYAPGTNVLQANLEETRQTVEELLWVRHATIQRVWPNEIAISLVERQPIALVRINSEIFQVDIEGVVLSPDGLTEIDAPILDGLHVGDPEGNEVKINIYRDIVEAIGESELSEVHVAESGEVSVVPTENPILIDLGLTSHRDRWEKYLGLSVQIHEDYPDAFRVDLRFRDQVIIQNKENEPAGNIIWGDETKLL
jgi:cell division septal protein FtsQ